MYSVVSVCACVSIAVYKQDILISCRPCTRFETAECLFTLSKAGLSIWWAYIPLSGGPLLKYDDTVQDALVLTPTGLFKLQILFGL